MFFLLSINVEKKMDLFALFKGKKVTIEAPRGQKLLISATKSITSLSLISQSGNTWPEGGRDRGAIV